MKNSPGPNECYIHIFLTSISPFMGLFDIYFVSFDLGKWLKKLPYLLRKQTPLQVSMMGFLSQLLAQDSSFLLRVTHFLLLLVSVVWKTLEADMRFSMY